MTVRHMVYSIAIKTFQQPGNSQGIIVVVAGMGTYMLPVEAFATAIKFFDRQKVCLIA